MAKSYVIWGCSGHAKVLTSLIKFQGDRVAAFFDNKEVSSLLTGTPFYLGIDGFQAWLKSQMNPSEISGLVAIGGHRGNERLIIQNIFRSAGLASDPLIHPHAFVCATASIGAGAQILAHAVVAADCKIGDCCIINHHANVDHECVLGAGVHLAPGATLCGCITVGDNVMIGAGAVVLPRLIIGKNSMIGAGAVVTKDVPDGVTVTGNPARVINLI
jgi:sugar O-acyltransferase (sialic acid O-acetyltransferase NeuD family)